MKLARFALRSINANLSHQSYYSRITRSLSTNPFSGNVNEGSKSNESVDDFASRIFGGGFRNSPSSESFFRKLDRLEKARNWPIGLGNVNEGGNDLSNVDDLDESDESFDTLSDGMDGKLKKAASYFEVDAEEIENDDHYAFRPDGDFQEGGSYEPKDLDLRRAPRPLPPKSEEFEVTTEDVLRKADFRNVRFLTNFITEAGIIIKRSKTGISAKAQRKVAREIKTARAFGLMPFTTMGTKSFVFGKTMEDQDKDFEYRIYDRDETDDF